MYTRPVLADFSHLDALLAELDSYRPLPQDVTRKLTEKLRLDWNYHSNALEGNTLTYGETKALLLADRYVGNKEGRHYREISAHNDVLKTLDELVNIDKDRALTEGLIRDLHKQMLGEPYYSYAETMDGHPIQKRIVPGEYKQQPNSVRRSTGEMFYYAEPFEVSAKMQELLEAYREMNTDPAIHPVALAAWFHYEFIRIHPFDDGNGRLARILMNLILQRRGMVPAIIRVEEKTPYIDALAVADGTDDLTDFTLFITKQVERILDLSVRAAKGEDITEPEDWKKEISIIRSKLEETGSIIPLEKVSLDSIGKIAISILKSIQIPFDITSILFEAADLKIWYEDYEAEVSIPMQNSESKIIEALSSRISIKPDNMITYNISLTGLSKPLITNYEIFIYGSLLLKRNSYIISFHDGDDDHNTLYDGQFFYSTHLPENEQRKLTNVIGSRISSKLKKIPNFAI